MEGEELKIYIDGEIRSTIDSDQQWPFCTLQMVRDQVQYQAGAFNRVRVQINSPGGSANEGNAIRDFIKSLNVPITTVGMGMVGSIATGIFAIGDERLLSEHCKFFVHLPSGGISGASADEIIAYGEATKRLENELLDIYEPLTTGKLTREDLINLCRVESSLSAQMAKDYGFATAILQDQKALLRFDSITNNSTEMTDKNKPLGAFAKFRKEVTALLDSLKGADEVTALSVTTDAGVKINVSTTGDTMAEGDPVTGEDGNALADGSYTLSDGTVISVANGKIATLAKPEMEDKSKEDEEKKALREENEALKVQLEEANKKVEAEVTARKADVEKVRTEVTAKFNEMAALMGQEGEILKDDPNPDPTPSNDKAAAIAERKARTAKSGAVIH